MIARLGHCALALFKAIDILGCAIWLSLLYPFNLASRPTGRQMISSYIGEAKSNGHQWAVRVAVVIDWCAERLGDRPEHCVRAFRHYRLLDD